MEPFRLTPDHHLCYRHPNYQRAKYYMEYAVTQGEDFVLITGEPGTGKTTLINDVLANVNEEKLIIARLIGMHLVREELLRMVAFAFGLNIAAQDNVSLLRDTRQFLIERSKGGRRALLIVDEAQTLSSATLEELRLLSNLQYNDVTLLQIFLVGQERLLDIVINPAMAQLHQRLIAACHLNPLNVKQTEAYIKHRLSLVGWQEDPKLHENVFPPIYQHSRGVPRKINLLCNRLFIGGFHNRKHELTVRDVRRSIEELRKESLVHSEGEVTKESSGSPALASQNTVLKTSNSIPKEQEGSQESLSFSNMSLRRRAELKSKPVVPLAARSKEGTRYSNNNTIIIITIGFLIGVFLTLTLVTALNFQKSTVRTLSLPQREGQDAKTLQVNRADNEMSQGAGIEKRTDPSSNNEQAQIVDGESPAAERASNDMLPREAKERQIISESTNQQVLWKHSTASDQQGKLNFPDNDKSGENLDVKTVPPTKVTTLRNESILNAQSRERDELQNQNKLEITKLLAKAERQQKAFQFTIPQGDNASETYQRVLKLDPVNKEAKEGLTKLARYYLRWARYYKNRGSFESSLDFIYRGLTVKPNDTELLALKEQVQLSLNRSKEWVDQQ